VAVFGNKLKVILRRGTFESKDEKHR